MGRRGEGGGDAGGQLLGSWRGQGRSRSNGKNGATSGGGIDVAADRLLSCGNSETRAWLVVLIKTLLLVGFYYLTSIGLTFFQNHLLKELKFPLSIVTVHFLVKLFLAWVCRTAFESYTGTQRIKLDISVMDLMKVYLLLACTQKRQKGWPQFIGRVGIVSLVASLDIGLSQWSFEYIEVALYTITKSTSIIFILFFAILFGLERKHWSLIFVVLMIASGLIMFTYKSTEFSIIGFSMVLSASFLSGIRWTLSQLIMQRSNLGLSNPVDMIYHVQPIMILALLPFTLGVEVIPFLIHSSGSSDTGLNVAQDYINVDGPVGEFLVECGIKVVSGGLLAFLMEIGEFMLITHTSSLTFSISGIFKEVLTLSLAFVEHPSELSTVNAIGLGLCVCGIALHVLKKATTRDSVKSGGKYVSSRTGDISLPLLSGSESDSEEELYRNSNNATRKSNVEETLLTDTRQWTSTRDKHVENMIEAQKDAGLPFTSDQMEMSALEESEKLLEDLDAVASD